VASSDLTLYHVLRMRRLLPEALLDERLRAATTRGVSLEQMLRVSKDLDHAVLAQALDARNRHARTCGACGETTYLQPNQTGATTPCERCGGELRPRAPSGRFQRLDPGPPPPR
jgi:NADH pyrophosphatase NudC (nudix superfamily)